LLLYCKLHGMLLALVLVIVGDFWICDVNVMYVSTDL
jgi:hypothetical protein